MSDQQTAASNPTDGDPSRLDRIEGVLATLVDQLAALQTNSDRRNTPAVRTNPEESGDGSEGQAVLEPQRMGRERLRFQSTEAMELQHN